MTTRDLLRKRDGSKGERKSGGSKSVCIRTLSVWRVLPLH